MPMHIFAVIAGFENFATCVPVEPHDTIAELMDKMERAFRYLKKPHVFVGAYSLVHTRPEGLTDRDPDNIALGQGEPVITAKYLTPAARLDPTKTVRDYFGSRVEPETASIVLVWPSETLALVKQEREDAARNARVQWVARERAQKLVEMGLRPRVTSSVDTADDTDDDDEEEESTPAASSWSPRHWFPSCLSTRPTSAREPTSKVHSKNAKKKTD